MYIGFFWRMGGGAVEESCLFIIHNVCLFKHKCVYNVCMRLSFSFMYFCSQNVHPSMSVLLESSKKYSLARTYPITHTNTLYSTLSAITAVTVANFAAAAPTFHLPVTRSPRFSLSLLHTRCNSKIVLVCGFNTHSTFFSLYFFQTSTL